MQTSEIQSIISLTPDEWQRSLLDECADLEKVRQVLQLAGLSDWRSAHRTLLNLADTDRSGQLAHMLGHLLATLKEAANPDRALANLERLVQSASEPGDLLGRLARQPRTVEIVVSLFSGSQFLTEILMRHPEYLPLLADYRQLARPKTSEQFFTAVQASLAGECSLLHHLDALRRFQRRELLRIGTCDLLGLLDLAAVTEQLAHLADSLIQACAGLAAIESAAGSSQIPRLQGFAVIAMGKLGGGELNYSSDIDLLFVAGSDPASYTRLGERLIDALTRVTGEGFLYRVDMRLRPWGQSGALVSSIDGYTRYLQQHARLWEKQALLKVRVIAGDLECGSAFLKQIEPFLHMTDMDAVRQDVHAMKLRTESYLRQRGQDWGQVKLGEGAIRDIEFVTQYLQLVYGAAQPSILSRNTLDGLARLAASGLLSTAEHRVLVDGYTFLRTIEHHLQMMHYRQTHTLPQETEALTQLARRLGFEGEQARGRFLARYEQHRAAIRAVYLRHLGSTEMQAPPRPESTPPAPGSAVVDLHLSRMDPSYEAAFSEAEIQLHATLAAHLDDEHPFQVHAIRLSDAGPERDQPWRVTIVGYDYPGELSLICGLLFAHGFNIHDGDVFTYEPGQTAPVPQEKRKIVDVFTVIPQGEVSAGTWVQYTEDLTKLRHLMRHGQQHEAQGELAKRIAASLHESTPSEATLYPVEIEIDNTLSAHYTVLRIAAPDTIGFLYELTNALALHHIYIARVRVDSQQPATQGATAGGRVHDTLYVTDAQNAKILAPEKQRELRAAVVLIKHFSHLLPRSPNPESALLHFRQFIGQLFQRPDWPTEFASLEHPQVLDALARLLGVSDFLWDDFLRMQHANLFPVVSNVDALATAKSRAQLQAELEAHLHPVHDGPQPPAENAPWRAALNAFKDREMFRIDMRHILGHTQEFDEFSYELTDLAEVVVNAAYHLCHEDLRVVYGSPVLEEDSPNQMSVCALGKCGGRELGFASDIELMFVYAGNGRTTGPQVITAAEFYEKLVQAFVSAIQAKREGIFEIDLQLRPYGKAGSMAVSLPAFRRYFGPQGPAWAYERQALVKLRPIAGDKALGEQVAALRDAYVYGAGEAQTEAGEVTGGRFDVTAMRAMRERQIRHLVTGGTFNAKFSPGGLVDVEYLVQGLQITHGGRNSALRQTNIREAMSALAAAGILSPEDHARLRRAHTFLRWLIDALRMVRGNARDLTVPLADSEAFSFLARRLRYGNDIHRLQSDLERHTTHIRELNTRLLG